MKRSSFQDVLINNKKQRLQQSVVLTLHDHNILKQVMDMIPGTRIADLPLTDSTLISVTESGVLFVLKELCRKSEQLFFNNKDIIISIAVKLGHIHILRWIYPHNKLTAKEITFMLRKAAFYGNIRTITWLYKNFTLPHDYIEIIKEHGLFGDNVKILQWLIFKGFDLPNVTDIIKKDAILTLIWVVEYQNIRLTKEHANLAATYGSKSIINYCAEHEICCNSDGADGAASAGHLDIVDFLAEYFCVHVTFVGMREAAKNGHIEVIRWLIQEQFNLPNGIADIAISNGHFSLCTLLDEYSYFCTQDGIYQGIKNGFRDIFLWAIEHEFFIGPECSVAFAENGQIDMLDELLRRGITISPHVLNVAVKAGNIDLLDWYLQLPLARDHIINHVDTLIHIACTNGKYHSILWLQKNVNARPCNHEEDAIAIVRNGDEYYDMFYCLFPDLNITQKVIDVAAISKAELIVKLLHEKTSFICSTSAATEAIKNNNLDFLKWMYHNGTSFTQSALVNAIKYGKRDVVLWLNNVVPLNSYLMSENYDTDSTDSDSDEFK